MSDQTRETTKLPRSMESPADISGISMETVRQTVPGQVTRREFDWGDKPAKPRRAKKEWTPRPGLMIFLCFLVAFMGGFLGALLVELVA